LIPEEQQEDDSFISSLGKGDYRMNLTHLFVAVAAAFSLGAVAAGQSKQEPQAQSGQTEAQSSTTAQGAQTPAQTSQSSDTIKQAQEKLSSQGHDAGPADGKLGAKTQAAVKEFQQSKGLQASGQLDQPTLAALGVGSETPGSASTGASGASGQSSTGATKSPEQSPAAPSAGSSSEPKAQEQPKEKY
jgi:peptidoglycan hydrolase-like protein with peptidoglycan-binding domain